MKYCKGCGKYISEKNNKDYCKFCFKLKHYGEIKEDNHKKIEQIEIGRTLNEIKKIGGEVFLIIDAINPSETIVPKINNYIKKNKLTIILNKIDVFPHSINEERIINWTKKILKTKNIEYKNIISASSLKKKNIDLIYFYIKKLNQNIHFIGYANVGKSSLINAIFNSQKIKSYNLVSEKMNSTKEVIESELRAIKFFDYPGFYSEGNILNYLNFSEIKKYNIQKEIKPRNFTLNKEKKFLIIDQKIIIKLEKSYDCDSANFQVFVSNDISITSKENSNFDLKSHNVIEIEKMDDIQKQAVMVSGLGMIIFNPEISNLTMFVPENINLSINSEESFLNK